MLRTVTSLHTLQESSDTPALFSARQTDLQSKLGTRGALLKPLLVGSGRGDATEAKNLVDRQRKGGGKRA